MNVKFGLIAPGPTSLMLAPSSNCLGKNGGVRRRICPQHRNSFIIGLSVMVLHMGKYSPKWKGEKSLHLHKGLAALRRSSTVPLGFEDRT